MNKMKLSAIVLGLAAAGALAQNAPAAAPAAAPAQPAAAAPAAAPAQPAAPAADAKKAEAAAPAQAAAPAAAPAPVANADSVKAAEEAAKKAEEEKAAAEAKKAEEEKAAAEAKKAEETKTAEAAPVENTNPGEVSAAAGNALDALKASMNEETSKANMEVKFSGEVEFDAYTNDVLADEDLGHDYATTADLNIDVKFNEKWSAHLGIEADAGNEAPSFGYNGAYVQYKPADFFYVQLGDLTFSEGAFVAYYGYDDPTYTAAGMKEHDIRGINIGLAGLELGIGFARNGNDERCIDGLDLNNWCSGANYNAHLAYEFNYAGQHLRPYVDYKSYQTEEHNELHAGIDAGLTIGGFSFRAVYGFHADFLGDDDDAKSLAGKYDMTSTAHTILAEPTFDVSMFQIKTTFFYAILDNDGEGDGLRNEVAGEVPEYMFIYAEPALKLAGFIKLGIPVEYHTNTLDDDASVETLDVGGRFYLSPVENLNITAFGMIDIPMGDDNDGDDSSLRFGVETVFSF